MSSWHLSGPRRSSRNPFCRQLLLFAVVKLLLFVNKRPASCAEQNGGGVADGVVSTFNFGLADVASDGVPPTLEILCIELLGEGDE